MSGSDESGDERRRGDRIPINEEFSADSPTWVSDLSRGGVFVHSAELLPVGSMIELRFTVLDGDPTLIEALAKVVRHSRRPQGMGVEFVSLSAPMSERIEGLLAVREPLDSGAPLRLPEPHHQATFAGASGVPEPQDEDAETRRFVLARPAPVEVSFGEASYEQVRSAGDEGATMVFRPPPLASKKPDGVDEDGRTRQFPVLKSEGPKRK